MTSTARQHHHRREQQQQHDDDNRQANQQQEHLGARLAETGDERSAYGEANPSQNPARHRLPSTVSKAAAPAPGSGPEAAGRVRHDRAETRPRRRQRPRRPRPACPAPQATWSPLQVPPPPVEEQIASVAKDLLDRAGLV